eukprot:583521-Prymnesium_polylepis.1
MRGGVRVRARVGVRAVLRTWRPKSTRSWSRAGVRWTVLPALVASTSRSLSKTEGWSRDGARGAV